MLEPRGGKGKQLLYSPEPRELMGMLAWGTLLSAWNLTGVSRVRSFQQCELGLGFLCCIYCKLPRWQPL